MTLVSCFPQFVVLLVGEFECELSRLALHLKTLHSQLVVEDEWLHLNANA